MMGRVVRAIAEAGVEDVCVVSPDWIVLEEAKRRGATPLVQESRGLNPALEEGRRRALGLGASTLLVLPADLPLLDAGDVRAVLQEAGEGPSAVISPDGGRSGTNALLIQPPDVLPFAFGADSFEAHLGAARRRKPGRQDLRAAPPRLRSRHGGRPGPPQRDRGSAPVRGVEVLGVEGLPEVRPGDDLNGMISGAVAGDLRPGMCSS